MILIGLGANLPHPEYGSPACTLQQSLEELGRRGVRPVRCSRWYVSPPWPASLAGQPWYVNGVAEVETSLDPDSLLHCLHEVEWRFGRVRTEAWAPRRIDLDLLAYHDLVRPASAQHGIAELPHPRMHQRGFVLLPLQEISPGWHHPVDGRDVSDLARSVGCDGIEPLVAEAVAQDEIHLAGSAVGS